VIPKDIIKFSYLKFEVAVNSISKPTTSLIFFSFCDFANNSSEFFVAVCIQQSLFATVRESLNIAMVSLFLLLFFSVRLDTQALRILIVFN